MSAPASKNVVLCCDGTWNRFDRGARTNVSKLCYCLERQRPEQVVFYDPGVGSIAADDMRTWIGRSWSKLAGGAFGIGLLRNVEEAYCFLMQHYVPGDRIFLFGFSRGAFCVRALAAILKLYGLMERGSENLFPYLRDMVKGRKKGKFNFQLAAEFKKTFARAVPVHFIGVWDTVSSVGWFTTPITLPYTRSNDTVRHARHAVAIDERRKNFRHNLFNPQKDQDVKEVWFAGSHADVGGGYAEDESGASKVALDWMLREAQSIPEPLLVDAERKAHMLGGNGKYARPDPLAALHDSMHGIWRLLQFVPRRSFRYQENQPPRPYWDFSWRPRPRAIDGKWILHRSVEQRLQSDPLYRPANPRLLTDCEVVD